MSDVKRPKFEILYSNNDFSLALEPLLVEAKAITYLAGRADEVEFQIEDRSGIIRDQYWPAKGDSVEVNVGYESGAMYAAGIFVIDEAQVDGPPWTVRVRGLSRSNKKALLQKNSRAFDNTTLKALASEIGKDLQVIVRVDGPNLKLERVTQHAETGLEFLHRIGWKYGFVVKILSEGEIALVPLAQLMSMDAVTLIEPSDVTHLSLRTKTFGAPRAAVVRYFDPVHKEYLAQLSKPRDLITTMNYPFPVPKPGRLPRLVLDASGGEQNVLKLLERAESLAQADLRASTALLHAQMGQMEGTITLPWQPQLTAGMTVYLDEFGGGVNGGYLINRCEQGVGYGGTRTELDIAANPLSHGKPSKLKKINTGKGRK